MPWCNCFLGVSLSPEGPPEHKPPPLSCHLPFTQQGLDHYVLNQCIKTHSFLCSRKQQLTYSCVMPLTVSFHRLTNCNDISFHPVPCLWVPPAIPVKSPCGLFSRTSPIRSCSWGALQGFIASPVTGVPTHRPSTTTLSFTAKPSRLQAWANSHHDRVLRSALSGDKNASSHHSCVSHNVTRKKKAFLMKKIISCHSNLEMGIKSLGGGKGLYC